MASLSKQPPQAPAPTPPADGNSPEATAPAPDAPASPTEPPAPEAAPEADPNAEATPAAPADPESPDPEAPTETPEGEILPTREDARLRLGLKKDDEVGRLAAAYKLRNKDWTLEQALQAAKDKLGVKPSDPKPAEAAKPEPIGRADLPQDIEGLDALSSQLEVKYAENLTALNFEEAAKINNQIRALDRQRLTLEREGERQQLTQAAEYENAFTASETRAAQFYPFAADPNSPLGQRMVEIEESLQALGDPLYNDPNKPLIIAQMVAKENNIAPRKPGQRTATPAPKPVAPAPKPAPKGMLPSGASRAAPAAATNPLADKISAARTPQELNQIMKSLGKRDF
jgi:hypothetical protein